MLLFLLFVAMPRTPTPSVYLKSHCLRRMKPFTRFVATSKHVLSFLRFHQGAASTRTMVSESDVSTLVSLGGTDDKHGSVSDICILFDC